MARRWGFRSWMRAWILFRCGSARACWNSGAARHHPTISRSTSLVTYLTWHGSCWRRGDCRWPRARAAAADAGWRRHDALARLERARLLFSGRGAGNIGELIARHNLAGDGAPNDGTAFDPAAHLLGISEIGLALEDVSASCRVIKEGLGLPVWDAGDGVRFRAMGGERGLLICVKRGHSLVPDERRVGGAGAALRYLCGGGRA